MNRPTAIVLITCTSGSLVALLALGTLLAWLIFGGGAATVAAIVFTVALANAADRRTPWRTQPHRPVQLHVVRAALPAGEPQ